MNIADQHRIGDRATFDGKKYIVATDKNFNLIWIEDLTLNVY